MSRTKSRRLQQRRRRYYRRKIKIKKQDSPYELYDGNMSYYPYAYCTYRKAWLTYGLANTHRCKYKNCKHLEIMEEYQED